MVQVSQVTIQVGFLNSRTIAKGKIVVGESIVACNKIVNSVPSRNKTQVYLRTLTQKSLLTSDIFDLWRLPKHRRRIAWRQNNVGKIADVTWRWSFRSPTLSNVGASNTDVNFRAKMREKPEQFNVCQSPSDVK